MAQDQVHVRYMVDDVQTSVDWYTANLGFKLISNAAPAFADVSQILLEDPSGNVVELFQPVKH